jgi:hypothetical protein
VAVVQLRAVDDLRAAYTRLDRVLEEALGRHVLEVRDSRDRILEDFFYQAQFVLHEAAANGGLEQAEARLRALGTERGVTVRLGVDSWRLYLQASDGGGWLYEVVARGTGRPGGASGQ